jgi:hypothetical protein
MPKKYYWTRVEEAKLIELWKKGITNYDVLAKELGRTPGAIAKKVERLSLSPQQQTTTTVAMSKDLLTHEQALKILAGALELLQKPGQDKLELQRLRILVDAVDTYDSVLEKFERWTEIESRLLGMDRKIQELQKAQKVSS